MHRLTASLITQLKLQFWHSETTVETRKSIADVAVEEINCRGIFVSTTTNANKTISLASGRGSLRS